MSVLETPLSLYYKNYYLQNCPSNQNYFATKLGLWEPCRIISTIAFPFQVLAAYCILKKTPENMKLMRASLLNLNFWSMVSGVTCTFFMCPYFYFPYMAGFTMGFLAEWRTPGVLQFYIAFSFNFAMMIAITLLFETRSSLISRNRFRISSSVGRYIWIGVNFFGSPGIFTPIFMNLPAQMDANMNILKTLPCPTIEFFTEPVLVLATEGFWKTYIMTACISIYGGLTLQVLFFTSCCIYYLFISKNSQVSAKTRQLQIRSFFVILAQTFLPIILVLVPMMILFYKKNNEEYDQAKNNIMFIAICVQNCATSLSILLVHHPYRSFLKTKICGKKTGEVKVATNVSRDFSTRA